MPIVIANGCFRRAPITEFNMKLIVATVALLAISATAATAEVVTLSFYKDSCEKFLQSEPSDQNMYLMWATGRIGRGLGEDQKSKLDDAAIAQWLRTYCGTHPTTAFADATAAAKASLTGAAKP